MGLFSSSSKHLSRQEVEKILKNISSLDYKEREELMGAFAMVDSGGISKEEFKKVIYELKNSYKISEIDYNNLKKVWEDIY